MAILRINSWVKMYEKQIRVGCRIMLFTRTQKKNVIFDCIKFTRIEKTVKHES